MSLTKVTYSMLDSGIAYANDFGADPTGATSSTNAFNAMFASGAKQFLLEPGATYKIKDVDLPEISGWSLNGQFATIAPDTSAATCFRANYTSRVDNIAIENLFIAGNVIDFIKFSVTGASGLITQCLINNISMFSGSATTIVTLFSTATGQGEAFKVTNITVQGSFNVDYIVYMFGGTSFYGGCEFKTIYHNTDAGVATIFAGDGLALASFDLIYHTRGSGVQVAPGNVIAFSTFTRMQTESVESGTLLFDGDFTNCSFEVSTVFNQLLSAPFTEQIASGVFTNCLFSNNFMFQTSGTTMTFAAGSTRNTVTDLQVGSIEFVQYDTISDAGTFNNFLGEQFTPANAVCTGAITSGSNYLLVKNGRMVTVDLASVSGIATALPSFSFGTPLPVKFRPTSIDASISAFIVDNAVFSSIPGLVTIDTNGVITVFKSANQTDNFTAGATAGLAQSVTISFIV